MDERELILNHYNYAPRPSKGATISTDLSDENNGFMTNKGLFTALGDKEVIFVSHPHKRNKHAKSAAATRARSRSPSPKASVKTPSRTSRYKKEAASRRKKVLAAKRSRRKKATGRARSASVDKISPRRSTTRRRSK